MRPRHSQVKTIGHVIAGSLARALIYCSCLVGGAALSNPSEVVTLDCAVPAARSDHWVDSTAQQLIARHHCWTAGERALVQIPGHVVVTPAGADGAVWSRRLTAAALAQVFDGRDAGLRVHAFCR